MDAPLPEGLVSEIQRIIIADKAPAGLDVYDAVFDSPLMFPLQRREEMRAMMRVARSIKPEAIMEIGADKAGGCYHWLKGLQPEVFVGIEIRGVPYGESLSEWFSKTECCWLARSSYDPETVAYVKQWLSGRPIDVLFIDGDKGRFYDDFIAYLPMVRSGGIVFMHDVADASPRRAYDQAATHPRVKASFSLRGTGEVAESIGRTLLGKPPASSHEGWLRHWRGQSCGVGVLWV